VIVLIGVLTYVCAQPLRLDQATLSALLLSGACCHTSTLTSSSIFPRVVPVCFCWTCPAFWITCHAGICFR